MGFIKFLFSKTFFKQILIAIVLTVTLLIALFYWLQYYTNHNDYITVPDLSKLSLDIVDKKLDQLGLRYVITDTTSYNSNYPSFSVVNQNPKPNQKVKKNRLIYLLINPKDYKEIKIPQNLIGKTKRQVIPSLKSLGFQIGKITEKPDIAKDVVLLLKHNQRVLREGDKLKKTSIIDLVVGDGK